jgi:ElaB/YqjD/DUF883 family membrane-anchored ribosome-binding protein
MTTSSDPDEIRADIERTRAALSDDVDALADTANPKNIAKRQADKAKDALTGVKDRVMGVADDVKDKVTGTGSDASGAARDRASAVGAAVSDRASAVGDAVSSAPETAKEKTRGNPLAAGLVAFGIGMLISGLIPSSQKEQEAVSGLQSNLEPLKEKATEAAREVGENLRGPAQEAVESVKSTATEGVENVKAEGQSAKDDVQSQTRESKDRVQKQAGS